MTKEEAIRILSTRDSYGMVTGYAGGIKEAIDMGLEALKQEPCPYWDYGLNTCRHANIGALATKPCEDAISRQAVLDIINERECHEEYCGNHCEGKCSSVCITIGMANKVADLSSVTPSVTPIRPKGEWETGYTFPDGVYWKCSVCKELIRVRIPMHFCSNCGADMDKEGE